MIVNIKDWVFFFSTVTKSVPIKFPNEENICGIYVHFLELFKKPTVHTMQFTHLPVPSELLIEMTSIKLVPTTSTESAVSS